MCVYVTDYVVVGLFQLVNKHVVRTTRRRQHRRISTGTVDHWALTVAWVCYACWP